MSNLEFFKKQSKNFLKDWKSQTKIVETDGNVYFRYSPKFFDIEDWFSYFELSAKDEQDVKLSHAQHYIAKIAGFKKWTDLIAASEKELIYAEIKLRNFKNSMDLIQWDYIEKDYELAHNKFDINTLVPFESKVLIRNDESQRWLPAFWGYKVVDGFITTFGWCKYCIPYEGNEFLFKTNNDCDDFYKTWEK